jgi:transcriptional regulator with GAF, ATPase, and Fis domain
MIALFNKIDAIAASNYPVLIQGESGTGKELVAKALHYNGSRSEKAFSAVNCAGIPSELLESTLFGWVKGAFTGAHKDGVGVFAAADGGTVFLDEISKMPLHPSQNCCACCRTGRLPEWETLRIVMLM